MNEGTQPDDTSPLLRSVPAAEIATIYLSDVRSPRSRRPWTLVGMLSSIDGGATRDGDSSSLGGPADGEVFTALRTVADVILVGASTVREEGYGAPSLPPANEAWRKAAGMSPQPELAIVTGSLDLPFDTDLFCDSSPIVVTHDSADPDRIARAASLAHVVTAGDERVDLTVALDELGSRGAGVVLVEGGPAINGQLFEADLVDEVCVTITNHVLGGDATRIVRGAPVSRRFTLSRAIESDSELLLRYLRNPS